MHRFWYTVVSPFLERLKPKSILEIGSERGLNTIHLAKFARDNNAILHVIDPQPQYNHSMWKKEYGPHIEFHIDLSLNAIGLVEQFDVILIDGDHNWYTVFHELQMIETVCSQRKTPFPAILLHDVGWPYGRRDLYYDPETVPPAYLKFYKSLGIRPESWALVPHGGLNQGMNNSMFENEPQSGVLTAIEDFLKQTREKMEFIKLPGYHGLGILVPDNLLHHNAELQKFIRELSPSATLSVYIDQLERSRIAAELDAQDKVDLDRISKPLLTKLRRRLANGARRALGVLRRDGLVTFIRKAVTFLVWRLTTRSPPEPPERFTAALGQTLDDMLQRIVAGERGRGAQWIEPVKEAILANYGRNTLITQLAEIRAVRETRRVPPAPRPAGLRRPDKLNLLFVCELFPSTDHGGGLAVYDILCWFAKRHRVYLYARYQERLDRDSMLRLRERIDGMRVVDWPVWDAESDRLGDLRRWIQRLGIRFDAAVFCWPRAGELIPAVAPYADRLAFYVLECAPRRAWIDLLNAAGDAEKTANLAPQLVESFYREQIAIGRTDLAMTVTDADLDFVRAAFDARDTVMLPTCVSDFAIWDRLVDAQGVPLPDSMGEPDTAIFLGWYEHIPNIESLDWFLSEVHPRVLRQLPSFKFVIAGQGKIDSLIRPYKKDPSVRYLGRVEDLVAALRSARITIAPLISGAGIRGKVNQYSAVGRASVATTIALSGLAYVDGESVLLADTAEDFADAIVRLLKDEALQQRIREGAWKIVNEHYRWEAVLPEVETRFYGP